MDTIRAYRRNTDGTLEIIEACLEPGGHVSDEPVVYAGMYPLNRTDEIETLVGWPDGRCRVYETDGGVDVLVPEEA